MSKLITDLMSQVQIDSTRRPIETALTLPSKAFTDNDFYQFEIEKIYKNNWIACIFDTQLTNPGDIFPFEMCEMPFLATRGQDLKIRVFHNVCPYDGSLIAIESSKGLEKITVPYHGWEYKLDGKLLKTPYWDGTREGNFNALEGKKVDLIEVNSNIFMNVIFINLSENPENFKEYITPVISSTHEYNLRNCKPGKNESGDVHISTSEVATNWKTLCENACLNVLHENFVHGIYNASPEVPRIKEDKTASYKSLIDGKFMALSYDRQDFLKTYPIIDAPHLGKNEDIQPNMETFGTLYPNFYFSASSQFIEVAIVLPHGPNKIEQNAIYQMNAELSDLAPVVNELANAFSGAFNEDARICENLQKAKKSPVYQQKFYAPFWDSMHYKLTNLIMDDLEK